MQVQTLVEVGAEMELLLQVDTLLDHLVEALRVDHFLLCILPPVSLPLILIAHT